MTIHDTYKNFFETWYKEYEIKNSFVSLVIYNKQNPIFINYDTWKLANKDDFYSEKTITKKIDKNVLEEDFENIWMTEIGPDGIKEAGNDKQFLYQESVSLFNRALLNWLDEQSNELINEERD